MRSQSLFKTASGCKAEPAQAGPGPVVFFPGVAPGTYPDWNEIRLKKARQIEAASVVFSMKKKGTG
jgi:hypothetical protein